LVSSSREHFLQVLKNVKVTPFAPKKDMKIATTDQEAKQMEEKVGDVDEHEKQVQDTIKALPTPASLAGYRLRPIEFEKDDDTNFHLDFITACSNLRARNYKIKEATNHETKFTAGKIIPAIATTTALVTGLVCLEVIKLVQEKPVTVYRNSYGNLALSLFAQSEPIPPQTQKCPLPTGDWNWSLWDRIDIAEGDITLADFLKYFKNKYSLEVNMLSYQSSMLYYTFGGMKKMKERMGMRMSQLVQSVGKLELKPKERFLVLEVCVVNDAGEDVEIPYVRFKFA